MAKKSGYLRLVRVEVVPSIDIGHATAIAADATEAAAADAATAAAGHRRDTLHGQRPVRITVQDRHPHGTHRSQERHMHNLGTAEEGNKHRRQDGGAASVTNGQDHGQDQTTTRRPV